MTRAPDPRRISCDLISSDRRHRPCVTPDTLRFVLLTSALLSGCATNQLLMPNQAPPPRPPTKVPLSHIMLDVCDLDVTRTQGSRRGASDHLIRMNLKRYIKAKGQYAGVFSCGESDEPTPWGVVKISLKTTLLPNQTSERSWLFDVITAFPSMGFFTPQWGRARVKARVEFSGAPKPLDPLEITVSAPYSILLYSWFRTAPTAYAFQRAHRAVFDELGDRIARHLQQGVPPMPHVRTFAAPEEARARTASAAVALISPPGVREPFVVPPKAHAELDPLQLLVGTEYYADALAMQAAHETRLPGEGFRLIAEPVVKPESDSFISQYLGNLGGLEASITGGIASVRSNARTERRGEETVGSGSATSRGYRFSVYRPPDRTGFFFPLRLGFFSQDITISGFREDLPDFTIPGSDDIPALVSDPNTGLPFDINAPVSYFLRLKSGYLGHGIGFNLVLGTDDIQFFSSVAVGLNFVEVRHADVEINESREKGWSAAFFESGQLYAQLGFEIPAWHIALRTSMEFEWFRGFDYPNPLEFRAGVAFNEERQTFERERVFVSGASLTTFNWQVSAIYLF